MAVLIAAVGNGGTLFRPRIVRTIKDGYGVLVKKIEPEITGGLPASKETLKIVRKGLLKAVQGQRGTAKKIRLENIEIAGKTGTAQVYSIKKNDKRKTEEMKYSLRDHAWFVCYAPADNPVIAIAVLVEHGEHGSSGAAPIAGALIEEYIKGSLSKKTLPE
jgi:penicillin-binding protein 2